MLKNVLDAIRDGDWFFEPDEVDPRLYPATAAIPGTDEKLEVLAARVRAGLPLWHKSDRPDYDDSAFRLTGLRAIALVKIRKVSRQGAATQRVNYYRQLFAT